jgi:hypothetical protein
MLFIEKILSLLPISLGVSVLIQTEIIPFEPEPGHTGGGTKIAGWHVFLL